MCQNLRIESSTTIDRYFLGMSHKCQKNGIIDGVSIYNSKPLIHG